MFVTTFACNRIIMQVGGDITFFNKTKQNSNGQHSLLDNNMSKDFKTEQTWNK